MRIIITILIKHTYCFNKASLWRQHSSVSPEHHNSLQGPEHICKHGRMCYRQSSPWISQHSEKTMREAKGHSPVQGYQARATCALSHLDCSLNSWDHFQSGWKQVFSFLTFSRHVFTKPMGMAGNPYHSVPRGWDQALLIWWTSDDPVSTGSPDVLHLAIEMVSFSITYPGRESTWRIV